MVYWNEPRPLIYEKPKFHQSKLCWKGSCVLKSVFWSRRSTSRLQTSVCDPSKTRAQTVAQLHDETWRTFSNSHTETERVWRSVDTTGQVNSLSWDTQTCLLLHFPFSPTCMCCWLWPYPFMAGVRLKKFFSKFVRPNYRRSSKIQYRTHKVMLLPP